LLGCLPFEIHGGSKSSQDAMTLHYSLAVQKAP
jgi:hypothetical protein